MINLSLEEINKYWYTIYTIKTFNTSPSKLISKGITLYSLSEIQNIKRVKINIGLSYRCVFGFKFMDTFIYGWFYEQYSKYNLKTKERTFRKITNPIEAPLKAFKFSFYCEDVDVLKEFLLSLEDK